MDVNKIVLFTEGYELADVVFICFDLGTKIAIRHSNPAIWSTYFSSIISRYLLRFGILDSYLSANNDSHDNETCSLTEHLLIWECLPLSELPTRPDSADISLKINQSFLVLMNKLENFPVDVECHFEYLPDCCTKSP